MTRRVDKTLDAAIADARKTLVPGAPDWAAVDEKLFARIDEHERAHEAARVARLRDRPRAWSAVGGALAAAAALALLVAHKPSANPHGEPLDRALDRGAATASALVQQKRMGDGTGDVLVHGAKATNGADVRAGDVVETHGATVFLARAAAGAPSGKPAVAWTLEDESRVSVTKAVGALVVALERGAVEAQVTPVPNGEAFAVDVAALDGTVTRVAVHGTHLRVARVETAGKVRVVVDLTEGVVSIGAPPRSGSTYGPTVNAPAHVEFDAADPKGSLAVSHTLSEVRPPVDIAAAMASPAPVASGPATAHDHEAAAAPLAVTQPPKPLAAPSARATHEPAGDPERAVAAAVKACMAAHPQPGDEHVRVTVESALELRVNDSGTVEFARFDPPLLPDVQSCAAATIYKTHFPKGGTVHIQLDMPAR